LFSIASYNMFCFVLHKDPMIQLKLVHKSGSRQVPIVGTQLGTHEYGTHATEPMDPETHMDPGQELSSYGFWHGYTLGLLSALLGDSDP
jgi:hypothetical protein